MTKITFQSLSCPWAHWFIMKTFWGWVSFWGREKPCVLLSSGVTGGTELSSSDLSFLLLKEREWAEHFSTCGFYLLLLYLLFKLNLLLLSNAAFWGKWESIRRYKIEDITVVTSAEKDKNPQLMKMLMLTPLQTTDSNPHLQFPMRHTIKWKLRQTCFSPRCPKHSCD